jgi:hypothetical protein
MPTQAGIKSSVTSFRRHEYKYLIPQSLMEPVRDFILPYCDMDPFAHDEADEFYKVKTLYLDSADHKCYWDLQEEAESRFELRVRAYGRDSGGSVKLEIKRRFNDVCYKTAVKVHEEIWPELFLPQNSELTEVSAQSANPTVQRFLVLAHAIAAGPKMLIQHERQAFQSRIDRYVRITFDRRTCHQPKHSYDLRANPAHWVYGNDLDASDQAEPMVILELKMMAHPPIWLLEMIRRFELVRMNHSKYCAAVTRVLSGGGIARETPRPAPVLQWRKRA